MEPRSLSESLGAASTRIVCGSIGVAVCESRVFGWVESESSVSVCEYFFLPNLIRSLKPLNCSLKPWRFELTFELEGMSELSKVVVRVARPPRVWRRIVVCTPLLTAEY
jgi:hypothetical protein